MGASRILHNQSVLSIWIAHVEGSVERSLPFAIVVIMAPWHLMNILVTNQPICWFSVTPRRALLGHGQGAYSKPCGVLFNDCHFWLF